MSDGYDDDDGDGDGDGDGYALALLVGDKCLARVVLRHEACDRAVPRVLG